MSLILVHLLVHISMQWQPDLTHHSKMIMAIEYLWAYIAESLKLEMLKLQKDLKLFRQLLIFMKTYSNANFLSQSMIRYLFQNSE
jgi:hypothetical protein